jgi:hypothetical protein
LASATPPPLAQPKSTFTKEEERVLGEWFLANEHRLPSSLTYDMFIANPRRFAPATLFSTSATPPTVELKEALAEQPAKPSREAARIQWGGKPTSFEG